MIFLDKQTSNWRISQDGGGGRMAVLQGFRCITYHLLISFLKMQGHQHWNSFSHWLYSGGHGRRKLAAVPPDVDGYTGRLIRTVSGAGKTILYVVPLQQDLDLTPLPYDAPEFQKMPKTACQVCKESMPLHILALHIKGCIGSQSATDDDEEVNEYVWDCFT